MFSQLYALLVAGVVLALLAAVSVLGLLLGVLYAKMFGARENRVKAAVVALLFLVALELLFNIPLPSSLVHLTYTSAAVVYGSTLYLTYTRSFNPAGLLEGLGDLELKLLTELSRGGVKLRMLQERLEVDRNSLLSSLSRLEERELVELDLEKRYRLTELGRLAALKLTRRARLA